MKEINIKVKGMVCNGCENRVQNALSEVSGVEKVKANHETGIVKVTINDEIERKILEDTIKDIGFETVKED